MLAIASPAGAHGQEAVLPPPSYTETDCTDKVPIVVASDAPAQSDLYSAVTLAGVLDTRCVVLAGPRDEPMPEAQLARLEAAADGGFIVGGSAAVPDAKVANHALTRLAGTDRWHTARLVGAQALISAGGVDTGTVEASAGAEDPTTDCTGDVAILVASDEAAQSDLYSAVTLAGVIGTDCIIVGGLDAVPQEKFEGLSYSLTRIAGDDRWHTAQLVSTHARRIAQGEPTEATEEGAVTYTALSSGFEHSCALRSDGTAVCWGSNVEGKASPPEGTFTAVSVGGQHTCGLRTDRTVACWGLDEDGQSTPNVGEFAAVSAGEFHTCGLAATNDMFFCWGLLTGSGSGDFAQLSAHLGPQVCVRHGDGTVTCWGAIYEGGGPVRISIPQGAITAVSTGGRHACGIALGTVFCWGEDSHGQVTGGGEGNAHVVQNQNGDVVPFVALSAGGLHTCGLAEDGTIHCWGDNRGGRATPPMS
ncbi:RCC1 domain-containing protein [Candidatus Poriferisodalis sp.]|uniref:RCC1 domain-containing protein n=1 Tax=Candidatus Poriferisodalis sp. TaxID=3101277 RepID=UPI003B59CE83